MKISDFIFSKDGDGKKVAVCINRDYDIDSIYELCSGAVRLQRLSDISKSFVMSGPFDHVMTGLCDLYAEKRLFEGLDIDAFLGEFGGVEYFVSRILKGCRHGGMRDESVAEIVARELNVFFRTLCQKHRKEEGHAGG